MSLNHFRHHAPIVILLSMFIGIGCGAPPSKPKLMYGPNDDHRGIAGCGIPCTSWPPPNDCVHPNGVCSYAQLMNDVSYEANETAAMRVSVVDNGRKIRYEFIKDHSIDREKLKATILSQIAPEFQKNADEIAGFVISHFNVPKDIPYSKESSKRILENYRLKGKSIVVKAGEYNIIKTKEFPFGYFEVDIATSDDIL